eukprot:918296-Amphidinium_carterae.1
MNASLRKFPEVRERLLKPGVADMLLVRDHNDLDIDIEWDQELSPRPPLKKSETKIVPPPPPPKCPRTKG